MAKPRLPHDHRQHRRRSDELPRRDHRDPGSRIQFRQHSLRPRLPRRLHRYPVHRRRWGDRDPVLSRISQRQHREILCKNPIHPGKPWNHNDLYLLGQPYRDNHHVRPRRALCRYTLDDFSGTSLNTDIWETFGTATITVADGKLTITGDNISTAASGARACIPETTTSLRSMRMLRGILE